MGTIQLPTVYSTAEDLTEEDRLQMEREAQRSALDVMEPAFRRNREAEERASRIASTPVEEWQQQRDGGGLMQAPEQTITGTPKGNAPVETPETVLAYARQRTQGTQRGLGRIQDGLRTPGRQGPAQQAAERQKAARDVVQNPRDPAAAREMAQQMQRRQTPTADPQVAADPALREAMAKADRNAAIAAIAGLASSALGTQMSPGASQRFADAAGDPVERYMTLRGVRVQDQQMADQRAQRQAQTAQQQAEQQRRAEMDERRMSMREQQVAQRQPLVEAQARSAQALAQMRELEAEAARGNPDAEAALTDPGSMQSQNLQTFYLDTLARSQGLESPEELDPRVTASVRGMSARQLSEDPLFQRRVVGEYAAQRSRRGGGSGGGGGLGSRGRGASKALKYYEDALDATGSADQAAQMTQRAYPGFQPPSAQDGAEPTLSPRQRSEATAWARMNMQAGIPENTAMLGPVEQMIRQADPGTIQRAVAIINTGTVGRELLQRSDPQAARLAQAIAQLSNVELRRVSGAAVSDQEFERFKQGIGTGNLSPELVMAGIGAIRRNTTANIQQIDAGFPGIRDYVQSQRQQLGHVPGGAGGQRAARQPQRAPAQAAEGSIRIRTPGGRLMEQSRQRLEAAARQREMTVEEMLRADGLEVVQ